MARRSVLQASLKTAKAHSSASPVTLTFQLTNTTREPVRVLKWYTPLEGLASDCLNVVRNGKRRVPYDGRMIKRGAPGPDDYVLLQPGETAEADVQVNEAYAVSTPADYAVELSVSTVAALPATAGAGKLTAALAKAAPQRLPVRHAGVKFKVAKGASSLPTRGGAARKAERSRAKARAKAGPAGASSAGSSGLAAGPLDPIFTGGSAAQQKAARQAHKEGFDLCTAAHAAVADDARYNEWFGSHTTTRAKEVSGVYAKIMGRMRSIQFTYDLTGTGCGGGSVYAYTYKGGSTVWLCDMFWSAPATGTDSRAGTVLHEHSHCDADTDDVQDGGATTYGQAKARKLALKAPAKAIRNADNFEYFAGG